MYLKNAKKIAALFQKKVDSFLKEKGLKIDQSLEPDVICEIRRLVYPFRLDIAFFGQRGNPETSGYLRGIYPPSSLDIPGESLYKKLRDKLFLIAVRDYGTDIHRDHDPVVDQKKISEHHWEFTDFIHNEITEILSRNSKQPEGFHFNVVSRKKDKEEIDVLVKQSMNLFIEENLPDDIKICVCVNNNKG